MKIAFPYSGYEGIESVELPDQNLLGVYEPLAVDDVDEEDVLARSFDEAYGAPHLPRFADAGINSGRIGRASRSQNGQ